MKTNEQIVKEIKILISNYAIENKIEFKKMMTVLKAIGDQLQMVELINKMRSNLN